jgi:4-amino-4-deoxy-L-arabinose transferase-like glycosyltransferase
MQRAANSAVWRSVARARVWMLPALVLLAVTLPHLEQGDFRGDAGWYSAIGLQAWRSGELWTLHAPPGDPYFNKPPLAFWIHGLVLHALGPKLWAARLPTIAAALACVLFTVGIARCLSGPRTALFSGIVLALTLEFFRRTREVSLDMWQAAFLLAALWCFVRGSRTAPLRWFAAAGAFVGLALLTKPLVALLIFPIVMAWLLWAGQRRLTPHLGMALVIALALATPWHLSMATIHGQAFVGRYFGTEIAQRAAGRLNAGHETAPEWWFYFRKLGTLYWPWLPAAGLGLFAIRRRPEPLREKSVLAALAVLWLGLWLLFLTVYPDRRDRYALVLYPGLAWLAGLWLASVPWPRWRWAERLMLRAMGPVVVVVALIVSIAPVRLHSPPQAHWRELFVWLRSQGMPTLWQGGLPGVQSARLFLEFGSWPMSTRTDRNVLIAEPPSGSLLVYHYRSGWAPGPGEDVVFRTANGDLVVTRLIGDVWRPILVPDLGE